MQTNNNGSPDGDLAAFSVSYVTNFTAPNQVTNLSSANIAELLLCN
jgi:hypothetical protein